MPDVALEAPEVDVEEEGDPFKRRVALLVVFLTLLGSMLAYAHEVASNNEDVAARDAQRQSVAGLGAQVEASAAFARSFDVYTQAKILERQRITARQNRQEDEAKRLGDIEQTLAPLTPLLGDKAFNNDLNPSFARRLEVDQRVDSRIARLRQEAKVREQNGWGGKADSLVAVITVLAVGLFLVGLSLTTGGRLRPLLLFPAIGIAVWCVAWSAVVIRRGVDDTPEVAITATADGDRLSQRAVAEPDDAAARQDLRDAIADYDKAVKADGSLGAAFAGRADARFVAGSRQDLIQTFAVSSTDPAILKDVIADSERAIALGQSGDVNVVGSLGFYYFLAGRNDDARNLTQRAIALNDRLPELWFNLGVTEQADGNDRAAEKAYDQAIARLEKEPNLGVQEAVYAGARTDLEILARAQPAKAKRVIELQERITAREQATIQHVPLGERPKGIDISDVKITGDGAATIANFRFDGIPKGSHVGYVWYHRGGADEPWTQPSSMTQFIDFVDDGSGHAFVRNQLGPCPTGGEYRIDVYVEGSRVSTAEGAVAVDLLKVSVAESDAAFGLSICRPPDWVSSTTEAGLAFVAPDGKASLGTGTFVLDQTAGGATQKTAVEDEAITTLAAAQRAKATGLKDFTFGGVQGRLGFFGTDAGKVGVATFLGQDGVIRFVIALSSAPDFHDTDELLATLRFTDVPVGDPGRRDPPPFGPS